MKEEKGKIEVFVGNQASLINQGFDLSQIRKNVWRFCLRIYANQLDIEKIIDNSMQIYAAILLRIEKQRQKEEKISAMKELSNCLKTN